VEKTRPVYDPITLEYIGEETYYEEESYNWYILNIQLTSVPFSGLVAPQMNAEQTELYHVLMQSKGNRQSFGNPFSVPWQSYVTDMYGWRVHPISGELDLHRGLDIGMAGGTPIFSIMDGTVITAASHSSFGNYVVVEDEKGYRSLYAHCQSLSVSAGQDVTKGQEIARVGSTGDSTGNHLHLELTDPTGEYLNPYFFIEGTNEYTPPVAGRSMRTAAAAFAMPPAAPQDERFTAMITEAEKYLGFPYVWGGSTPDTGFDCSGFVCWVVNQSGAGDVGRTTAQGLYDYCTPVSASDAKPGDLLFFTGTYNSVGAVSHVAIYVGGGMAIQAGNPIQYANINTPYWRSHFYAYGRLP
jgi:cell wall-associated NlpC family hydrolase